MEGCGGGCLGEIGEGIGSGLRAVGCSGFSGMEEEEEAWISVEEGGSLGALSSLDSLALSRTTKRRKRRRSSEVFKQLGWSGARWILNCHRQEQLQLR